MNGEMVEPDRTIMIISIIGLVVIWGSFFYHKFVQGGGARVDEADISDGDEQNSEHEKPEKKGKNKKGKR